MHDGFTLADLFSYNDKHNEANGEDNRDGSNDNHSNNCGDEGPTDDPAITALRRQLRKNQLACLLLAQGMPLMLAGDEVGNTQNGNNNAYCQDNEIGWVELGQASAREGDDLTDFIGHMTELRRRFPQLRAQRWLDGRRADGSYGVLWLTPAAEEMKEADWNFPEGRFLAYVLGADRTRAGADLYRAERRARRDRIQHCRRCRNTRTGSSVLNTADGKQTAQRISLGQRGQGAAALGACLCGCGMNDAAIRPAADKLTARRFGCGRRRRNASICCWSKPHAMQRGEDGWFTADIAGVKAGARYKFRIDDEIDVPDPASAFQPDDVFGPSEVIDHASLSDGAPRTGAAGRGRKPCLIEAHVGTFTPEGTYRAMIDKLDHLAADRHHRAGIDAAGGFRRRAQLGL